MNGRGALFTVTADLSENRQIELQKAVDDFLRSNEQSITFDSSLTSTDRLFLHQVAQKKSLKHQSRGNGSNRQLTLSKEGNSDCYYVNVAVNQTLITRVHKSVNGLSPEVKLVAKDSKALVPHANQQHQHPPVGLHPFIPPGPRRASWGDADEGAMGIETEKVRNRLPIHSYRDTILNTIRQNRATVIVADTGAGKTTQVPQYLLEWHAEQCEPCLVLVSQPRRLAVIASSERVAHERGESVGETVGYCIKHASRYCPERTRLLFCTTGTLLRLLIMDKKLLQRVTHLIIDEVHERDRHTDFLLCVLKNVLFSPAPPHNNKKSSSSLKAVLMSASINERQLSDYFLSCPVVSVPGRMYPVQQMFLENILLRLKKKEKFEAAVPGTSFDDSESSGSNVHENENKDADSDDVQRRLDLVCSRGLSEGESESTKKEEEEGDGGAGGGVCEVTGELMTVFDEGCAERVEISLADVDNLLLLFFHTASAHAVALLVRLVLNGAITVDHQHSESGLSALMIACTHGLAETVRRLMELGARPQLADREGKTAADYAVHNSHHHLEPLLNISSKLVDLSCCEDIEEGLQLVDDYARSFSADNETVNTDLILRVLRYIVATYESDPGSVLIFLPGYEEIFFLRSLLEADPVFEDTSKYRLFVLHSNVNTDDQRKVFDKCEQRKIILSTNVAETSLTIDDVSFVIDPGKTKERDMDFKSSLSYTLQVTWASKANVKQRAGRAGRTKPGYTFHLFSKARYESMKDFSTPEILRYPLNDLCLQTKVVFSRHLSVVEILSQVPDPPAESTLLSALSHLQLIGAFDEQEQLTRLGGFLVKMPLDPDLARMVLFSLVFRCVDPVCIIAATLAYRSPFFMPNSKKLMEENERRRKKLSFHSQSDHFTLLFAFLTWNTYVINGRREKAEEFCRSHNLSWAVLEVIDKTRQQILRHLVSAGVVKNAKSFVYFNSNARVTACVRAAIFAALSHMLVVFDSTRGKYCCEWSNNLKLHKSSAISSHSDLALCLCCDEISRGVGQPMIKAATAVHPLLILLFHNEVQELDSAATDNFSLFKVSPVIRFTSDCKTASLVASVRKVLKHVVLSLVHGSFIDAEIQGVMECVIELLEQLEPVDVGFIPQYQNDFIFAQETLFNHDHRHLHFYSDQQQHQPNNDFKGSRHHHSRSFHSEQRQVATHSDLNSSSSRNYFSSNGRFYSDSRSHTPKQDFECRNWNRPPPMRNGANFPSNSNWMV